MSTPPSSVHFPAADDADNVDIPAGNWGLKNKKSQLSTARYTVEGGDSNAEKVKSKKSLILLFLNLVHNVTYVT